MLTGWKTLETQNISWTIGLAEDDLEDH